MKRTDIRSGNPLDHSFEQRRLPTVKQSEVQLKIPLRAYLASALTGLPESRRKDLFEAQDTISLVCKEHGIDLYQPRLTSDPVKHQGLSPPEVYSIDRQRVLESDLLLVMTDEPSFGAGQELEFARNALLPVILLIDELRKNLAEALNTLNPIFLQRRLEFGQYDAAVIGANIKKLREENGMTKDQLAQAIGVTQEEISSLEENPDHLSNPALILLRKLSLVFNVSLPELVLSDYTGVVANQLIGLLSSTMSPIPMRGQEKMPVGDRRRIWARVLRRALDELER